MSPRRNAAARQTAVADRQELRCLSFDLQVVQDGAGERDLGAVAVPTPIILPLRWSGS